MSREMYIVCDGEGCNRREALHIHAYRVFEQEKWLQIGDKDYCPECKEKIKSKHVDEMLEFVREGLGL